MYKKIAEWFKKIGNAYYKWKKRNEDLENFLANSSANCSRIESIDATMKTLNSNLTRIEKKVTDLEGQMKEMNGRIEIIGHGTKMELFETLLNFREEFVVKRGWASAAEKKDVKEVYEIYHDKLKGNGQGEHYFKEINELPESVEEMIKRQGGNIA